VLKSNIAACHLKLEDWKEAIKVATAALDCLDRLQGIKKDEGKEGKKDGEGAEEEADEEIVSVGATRAEDTSEKGKRETDIERIRAKALMRRAKARTEQGGWASLQGAEEGKASFVKSKAELIFPRLQNSCENGKPVYGRSKCRQNTARETASKDKSGPGDGNGRYDGKVEIGKLHLSPR